MTPDDAAKPPCPRCGEQDARTLETRWNDHHRATYRRRVCLRCGTRYSTLETVVPEMRRVNVITVTMRAST